MSVQELKETIQRKFFEGINIMVRCPYVHDYFCYVSSDIEDFQLLFRRLNDNTLKKVRIYKNRCDVYVDADTFVGALRYEIGTCAQFNKAD